MVGETTGHLKPSESVATWIVGGGALVAGVLSIIAFVASALHIFRATAVRVNGVPLAAGGEYPPVLGSSDAPVDGGFETAWVEVANLPAGVRGLLWAETALPILTALAISAAIVWLAAALLRGRPFTRLFPGALAVLAGVIMVAGMASQLVGAIARAETVLFLGPADQMTGPGGFAGFWFPLDFSPIGWGLGIGLVASAFQIGTRLQRETAGLV
ncbi:hypothetical protein [Microbacterium sp. A1-JK]|uniref:hypothetical protein n=1 Tax=Microbacterium sp. A1-JK TaxID=3177516 RepID=UPI003888A73E